MITGNKDSKKDLVEELYNLGLIQQGELVDAHNSFITWDMLVFMYLNKEKKDYTLLDYVGGVECYDSEYDAVMDNYELIYDALVKQVPEFKELKEN